MCPTLVIDIGGAGRFSPQLAATGVEDGGRGREKTVVFFCEQVPGGNGEREKKSVGEGAGRRYTPVSSAILKRSKCSFCFLVAVFFLKMLMCFVIVAEHKEDFCLEEGGGRRDSEVARILWRDQCFYLHLRGTQE